MCVGVHEHAVFLLDPLGVNRQRALRHIAEGAGTRAAAVQIPSAEHEAFARLLRRNGALNRGIEIIAAALVVGRHVRVVGDARDLFQLSEPRDVGYRNVQIGHVSAVKIGERIAVARVVAVDRAGSVPSPCIVRRVTELCKAGDLDIVLILGKPVVIAGQMLIQDKRPSLICGRGRFSGQCFYIVVYVLVAASTGTVVILPEGHIRIRHDVNVAQHFAERGAALRIPAGCRIGHSVRADNRELVRDGLSG